MSNNNKTVRIQVQDSEVFNHEYPISFQSYMNLVYGLEGLEELGKLYGLTDVRTEGANVVEIEILVEELSGLLYDFGLYVVNETMDQLTNE